MTFIKKSKKFVDDTLEDFSHFSLLAGEIEKLSAKLNRKIRVADLGAGPASYWNQGKLIHCLNNYISQLYLVDASQEFTKFSNNFLENVVYHQGILPSALSEFADDFFDLTVGLDLIEHFRFEEGMYFLYEVDRVTSHVTFIFTPNGLVWQPPSENNQYNAHLSGWTPKTLRSLGWKNIYGHTGFKKFYGPYGIRKKDFNKCTLIFHLLTLPVVRFFPKIAFSFSAIKYDKNPRVKIHS